MSATASRTFDAYKEASERRDTDRVLDLFTDDAVLVGYDKDNPPSSPARIEGKDGIAEMVRDIYGRDMTHEVHDEVIGEDRFSLLEDCEYPDGNRVFLQMHCELRDGKIARQVMSQTWDD